MCCVCVCALYICSAKTKKGAEIKEKEILHGLTLTGAAGSSLFYSVYWDCFVDILMCKYIHVKYRNEKVVQVEKSTSLHL